MKRRLRFGTAAWSHRWLAPFPGPIPSHNRDVIHAQWPDLSGKGGADWR